MAAGRSNTMLGRNLATEGNPIIDFALTLIVAWVGGSARHDSAPWGPVDRPNAAVAFEHSIATDADPGIGS